MKITVSGKHVDVGDALRTHIESHLEEGVKKYLDRVISVQVIISKRGHNFRVDISGNTGTHSGMDINSRAEGVDVYSVFDVAADKIEKQLRRYKRRITNHHKEVESVRELSANIGTKYIISDKEEIATDAPLIIAENTTNIERISVSDAVMRMDLADLPALMFINSKNNNISMIYRRKDGNIAWVDSSKAAKNT